MNLQKYKGLKAKQSIFENAYQDFYDGIQNQHNFVINQSKLKSVKSWPFIYWISDEFREKFKGSSVKDLLKNSVGLQTANNNRFLRYWWELESGNTEGWVNYVKGGPYQKWSGNLWLKVNWKNDGYEIKNYADSSGKIKSRPPK